MLWSQFSAIFANFQGKKWRFFKKQCYDKNFLHNLALFWVKNANFFAEFCVENIFKKQNIGPGSLPSKRVRPSFITSSPDGDVSKSKCERIRLQGLLNQRDVCSQLMFSATCGEFKKKIEKNHFRINLWWQKHRLSLAVWPDSTKFLHLGKIFTNVS
jgi:hypothetical protein